MLKHCHKCYAKIKHEAKPSALLPSRLSTLLWVKLLSSPNSILFGVFYHPPDSSLSVIEELNTSLSSIGSNTPLVLCGDFNVPSIDWSVVSPVISSPIAALFCSITQDHFLSQLVFILLGEIIFLI